jgi:hypothetical protein
MALLLRVCSAVCLGALVLLGFPQEAEAGQIVVTWHATATGAAGTLSASGSMVVDSSRIGADISLANGFLDDVRLTALLHDGSTVVGVSHRNGSPNDHEMALRFTNTNLENLAVQLVDTNTTDGTNDSLVFEFSPWYTAVGGTCNCDVALLVLHGSNAQNAPSPFFVSASPEDLRGTYAITARAVPDGGTTALLLLTGVAATGGVFRRTRR